ALWNRYLPNPASVSRQYSVRTHLLHRCFSARRSPPLPSLQAKIPGKTSRETVDPTGFEPATSRVRSEEHTSELQSRFDLVCRLLHAKTKPLPNSIDCT